MYIVGEPANTSALKKNRVMNRRKPTDTGTKKYALFYLLSLFAVTLFLGTMPTTFRKPGGLNKDDLATHTNHLASLLLPEPSSSSSSPSSSSSSSSSSPSTTIMSAYGVVHALSMLIPGAGTSTASHAELLQALYGGSGEEYAQKAVKELSSSLHGIIEEANAAFVAKSLATLSSYRDALKTGYDADIYPLRSAEQVNSWVSEKTRGKITAIIDDSVASQAALLLINAIYFKARWEHEFRPSDTNELQFTRFDGTSVPVQMMYMKYEKTGTNFMSGWEFEVDGVECIALRLRYQDGESSAVFAMPKDERENGSMKSYESKLELCQDAMLHRRAAWRVVDKKAGGYHSGTIFVPRFEVEAEHGLTTILRERLGLSSIFRPGDFSRIGDESLAVSEVKQKIFLKVDEEGTEAAAVTVRIGNRLKMARTRESCFTYQHYPSLALLSLVSAHFQHFRR